MVLYMSIISSFFLCSKDDLNADFDYQNFNLFFAGHLNSWSEESVQKLKEFISNGGNVIFGSAFGSGSGSGSDSDPMRK